VQINYDPTQIGNPTFTQGDQTFYFSPGGFSTNIAGTGSPLWPGFSGGQPFLMIVTAPATGLDRIDFETQVMSANPGTSDIQIWAPAGTLASSTTIPQTLDAFVNYAQMNEGGWYAYSVATGYGQYGGYQGQAQGLLGDPPTPEPSSIILIGIGLSALIWVRKKSAGRRRTTG
jgi:hypothetical protein